MLSISAVPQSTPSPFRTAFDAETSSRIASSLSACHRENGSVSKRAKCDRSADDCS